jgi:hypothetical protein
MRVAPVCAPAPLTFVHHLLIYFFTLSVKLPLSSCGLFRQLLLVSSFLLEYLFDLRIFYLRSVFQELMGVRLGR